MFQSFLVYTVYSHIYFRSNIFAPLAFYGHYALYVLLLVQRWRRILHISHRICYSNITNKFKYPACFVLSTHLHNDCRRCMHRTRCGNTWRTHVYHLWTTMEATIWLTRRIFSRVLPDLDSRASSQVCLREPPSPRSKERPVRCAF